MQGKKNKLELNIILDTVINDKEYMHFKVKPDFELKHRVYVFFFFLQTAVCCERSPKSMLYFFKQRLDECEFGNKDAIELELGNGV